MTGAYLQLVHQSVPPPEKCLKGFKRESQNPLSFIFLLLDGVPYQRHPGAAFLLGARVDFVHFSPDVDEKHGFLLMSHIPHD